MIVIARKAGQLTVAAIAGAALASGCSRPKAAVNADPTTDRTVAVARAVRRALTRRLELAAEFRPFQQVDVHAKVAGYVKSIRVDVGDRVRAGELLAVLEIPELGEDVLEAEAAIRRDQEEVSRAGDEIHRAESVHEAAHLAYNRLLGVTKVKPNLVALQEVDDAMARDRVAEAQVETAKGALAVAREQLSIGKVKQSRVQTLFGYARILAPFSGVVTRRYADLGAMVQAGTSSYTQAMPLVTVAQNDRLRLVIPLPESVVPHMKLGGDVDVQVQSLGKTFSGKVARFVGALDRSTRTMDTEIDVPNPTSELVPGMYATASIILEQVTNALAVPIEALDRQEGQVSVLRLTPQHTLERRVVTTGLETANEVEIVSGLNDQDLVVTSGRSQLREGEKVQSKLTGESVKATP